MEKFSDYIIYVDESGDHGLIKIDPHYPVFALIFCVVRKDEYSITIGPAVQRFKFDFWGHDIRKSKGPFKFLMTNPDLRRQFYEDLNDLVQPMPVTLFASVINKNRLRDQYVNPWSPYEIALLFCMERLLEMLIRKEQAGKTVHVIFESRGRSEDRDLEIEFRRVCNNESNWGYRSPDFQLINFKPLFVNKSTNSIGLQLADLMVRPIALNQLRPTQENRAFEVISSKLKKFKCFPQNLERS